MGKRQQQRKRAKTQPGVVQNNSNESSYNNYRKFPSRSDSDADLPETRSVTEQGSVSGSSSASLIPPKVDMNIEFSSFATTSSPSSTSSSYAFVMKQALLMAFTFGIGLSTGIGYVGWVQQNYGFGQDAVKEQQLLPYGPTTSLPSTASDATINATERMAAQDISSPQQKQSTTKTVRPTLFGLSYDLHVHRDKSSKSDDFDESTTGGASSQGESCNATGAFETPQSAAAQFGVTSQWYHLASTHPVSLATPERTMIQEVAYKVKNDIPDLYERAAQVSWGGPHEALMETNWWYPQAPSASSQIDLDQLEGGHLLYAYLFIMKWKTNPTFPFRLCGDGGCPNERAISHTLEWREKYRPWLVPPTVLEENEKGYAYHRGMSPPQIDSNGLPINNTQHATVWLRVGHQVKNDLAFFRGILHSADRAIAQALVHNKGATGKFNVIFDCKGFSLSHTPSLHSLKQGVTMLQDHFPNRLGMIFLANLSRTGEMFLKVVLRLITKEVRDKVKILPSHDKTKSLAILKTIVEEEFIPDWLGGPDSYRFDLEEYYPSHHRCTEEEAQEFLTTMPYHAK